MEYYLAVDIGASSGRHMLSYTKDNKMYIEEIHRFKNGMIERNGKKIWDWKQLFDEILTGMKKCKELGKIPVSMGIDTWAVDFAILDENNDVIGDIVGYRDNRTQLVDKEVYKVISEKDLYQKTGIQKQIFNTIYQLEALKLQNPEQLKKAKTFLMLPDFFAFLLTGKKVTEYTNATTTQLVSAQTNSWDFDLIESLGFPKDIFTDICMPSTKLGKLKPEIEKEVGFNCEFIVCATHDTASAVIAVPSNNENTLYISSGTWSLIGTELLKPNCSDESRIHNFTNEGGFDYRFRYLKNIMGMWMINSVKSEIADNMSFSEICEKASECDINSIVAVDDERFLSPESMVDEVKAACRETNQHIPNDISEIAAVIYKSLAKGYADTVNKIEQLTGKKYDCIYIVGGGCNAVYLNELTAQYSKRTVYAGPVEASAIGNITSQMIALNKFANLQQARNCIFNSFEIKTYNEKR